MNTYTEQSASVELLTAALVAAQLEMEHAPKDAKNKGFNVTYATLMSVLDAVKPALNKQGIAVVQEPVGDGEFVGVATTLLHTSGQWKRSICVMKPPKGGPQDVGAIITYFRRYALAAVCGISQYDDDADAEAERERKSKDREKAAPRQVSSMSQQLMAELTAHGMTTAKEIIALYKTVLGKDKPATDEDRQKVIDHLLNGAEEVPT